jgi:[protein-PII] uridylyltransferase
MITSILIVLWDLGLKVGHATRSVDEAIHHANEDRVSKTAMLEVRFLVGEEKIFNKFQEKFKKKCLLGQEEEYIQWRLENIKKTQEKFGKSVFLQEPNIKSGRGGLRDYQNLLWISLASGEKGIPSYWIKKKFLRGQEQKKLEEAYNFLLRVRNEMHYKEKRAADQLTLRLQGVVSTGLGYPQRTILRRSEAFMKDYYEQTREVQLITAAALERMRQVNKRPTLLSSFFEIKKSEKSDGFLIKGKWLFPQNRDIFKDPVRMMRAFYLAQTRSLEFSSELNDLVKKEISFVDRSFQNSKEIRGIFLSILSRKGEVGRILRMMHDLGFLGKYLPEFGALTCLVQHEFFHRYTADEHTLVCIEKIDELLFTTEKKLKRYSTLFKNMDDAAMLYLGMLLHDTGKAANVRSHAEASTLAAEKVAHRFQLTQEREELLITLVKSHGELATVARTRDLDDITAVYQFANIVRKIPVLDALMILTLADGMGTSDTNWSDWKEQLVWNLYNQTKRYFEIGAPFFEQDQRDPSRIKKEVQESLGETFREEIEAHFEQMPERYLRMMSSAQIAEHLELFRSFFEDLRSDKGNPLEAQIKWIELPEAGHTEVWICGWDRKRLLERIAAAFFGAEINILSADIFTRRDYLTLDIFRVTSVRSDPLLTKKEKKFVEQSLKNYLENNNFLTSPNTIKHSIVLEKKDLNENTISPTVIIENESHPLYTVVKIETRDRQGLFYDLLGALNFQEISINLARIATEKKAAFDTFYLLDADKKKLRDEEFLNKLKERLIAVLS